jgi:hypothetical protein
MAMAAGAPAGTSPAPSPRVGRRLVMWILELALTTLWMSGIAFGLTMGGWVHVLALVVLALVLSEGSSAGQRLRSLFAH